MLLSKVRGIVNTAITFTQALYRVRISFDHATVKGIDVGITIGFVVHVEHQRRVSTVNFKKRHLLCCSRQRQTILVLSVLRIMQTGDFSSPIVCSGTDFQTTMSIVKALICHAAHVFAMLPRADTVSLPKSALLDNLPTIFDRTTYIQTAQRLDIPDSTADKQIARLVSAGLLTRQKHGEYTKNAVS